MNILDTIKKMGIATVGGNPISDVREIITKSDNEAQRIETAKNIIKQAIGVDSMFDNAYIAIHTAQGVVDTVIKNKGGTGGETPDQLLVRSLFNATKMVNDPKKAWMYLSDEKLRPNVEVKTVVKDLDVQVAVRADGKIKKGGNAIVVEALYRKYVLDAVVPMDNGQFKKLLMKELSFSEAGSSTFSYNVRKKLGVPAGMVKSKKGRQPKL